MDSNKIELALYVINLKIAEEIKNNTEKDFEKFKEKMEVFYKEKEEVYKENEEVVNKILTVYLEEFKNK
jgi:hypothetical protein